MKSHVALFTMVACDMAIRCNTSHQRDCETVAQRVKEEGMGFLTITLPSFGKDLERCLDLGYVADDAFAGFRRWRGLPRLFGGFLQQIFDRNSGRLLDEPSIDAIQAVRQMSLLHSKVFELSSAKRERAAMDRFVECENELARWASSVDIPSRAAFRRMSSLLFGKLFHRLELFCSDPMNLMPQHGPGATADRLSGNAKYDCSWPRRLDQHFSCADFLIPNYSYFEELQETEFVEPGAELPVRVISVPKTQKTPRIIAIEPAAMQYAQQSVRKAFYEFVEKDDILRTMIGFLDQTPNQRLAQEGSLTGELATLDLSEASDRVHCLHVRDLLHGHPVLEDLVFACRSQTAEVDGHGQIDLVKYASMGSALTFPIEAMVFLTVSFVGIEKGLRRPLAPRDVKSLLGSVRIFGDDIIIPVDYVSPVMSAFSAFGQKVNATKSFWTGRFRESCGKEYYSGEDVSIVKVRAWLPSNRQDVRGTISAVELRNQMYLHGCWQTARWLDEKIRKLIKHFPTVESTSPLLGRVSFLGYETQRMCPNMHRPLVKGFRIKAPLPLNGIDGYKALLKWFLNSGAEPLDRDHLERSGRPRAVYIKLGWGTPY